MQNNKIKLMCDYDKCENEAIHFYEFDFYEAFSDVSDMLNADEDPIMHVGYCEDCNNIVANEEESFLLFKIMSRQNFENIKKIQLLK